MLLLPESFKDTEEGSRDPLTVEKLGEESKLVSEASWRPGISALGLGHIRAGYVGYSGCLCHQPQCAAASSGPCCLQVSQM